mgnify:CR=1 FL=1
MVVQNNTRQRILLKFFIKIVSLLLARDYIACFYNLFISLHLRLQQTLTLSFNDSRLTSHEIPIFAA